MDVFDLWEKETVNIKSYEQWLEDKLGAARAIADQDESIEPKQVDCAACEGSGEVECDCGSENCYAEIECSACEGTGTVDTEDADLLEENERKRASKEEYIRELVQDLVAMSEWK